MQQPMRKDHRQADMSQADIARALGLGGERVRQIEVSALRQLRQLLHERGVFSLEDIV